MMKQRASFVAAVILTAVGTLLLLQARMSSRAASTLQTSTPEASKHTDPGMTALAGVASHIRSERSQIAQPPRTMGEALYEDYRQRYFTAVTFATQPTDGFCTFVRSAVQNHVPVHVLGWGREKMGHHKAVTTKVKAMEKYLRR